MAATPSTSFTSDNGERWKPPPTTECTQLPSHSSDTEANADRNTSGEAAISQAYEVIFAAFNGYYPDENKSFCLSQHHFELLLDKIEKQEKVSRFFKEKIRYNWHRGQLTLLMPAPHPIHESFKSQFDARLHAELNEIASKYPALKKFRKQIDHCGSASTETLNKHGKPESRTSPDSQFQYGIYSDPPLIYEVGRGSKFVDPKRWLADQNGQITTFIGFDIEYQPSLKIQDYYPSGSVILLTTNKTKNGLGIWSFEGIFRDSDGKLIPGELEIPFVSFLPLDVRHQVPAESQGATIRIPFRDLASLLKKAEAKQLAYEVRTSGFAEGKRKKPHVEFFDSKGNAENPPIESDKPRKSYESYQDPRQPKRRNTNDLADSDASSEANGGPVSTADLC